MKNIAASLLVAVVGCTGAQDAAPDASGQPLIAPESAAARGRFNAHRALFQTGGASGTKGRHSVLPDSSVISVEKQGDWLRPALAADVSRAADVKLPARGDGSFRLADTASGMFVEVALRDARPVAAEVTQGYVVYRGGHQSGADVLHRVTADGTEDYLAFTSAPTEEVVRYDLALSAVAGLRLVSNTLEMLDAGGSPRLRVAAPYLVGSDGRRHSAQLALEGCAADTSTAGPWGRAVTPAGSDRCSVRIEWGATQPHYPVLLDPTWSTTGSMALIRVDSAIAVLGNGQVLVSGGDHGLDGNGNWTYTTEAELYNNGTFAVTAPLNIRRGTHTAVTLQNGNILVAGGTYGTGDPQNEEIFNGTSFATVPRSSKNRQFPSATLLANGKVLLAGGYGLLPSGFFGSLPDCDLFDPSNNTWTATGPLAVGRDSHRAVLLASGKVLVAGGVQNNGNPSLNSAERFDPNNGTWSSAGTMNANRWGHGMVRLANNKVLVAGGTTRLANGVLSSAELYDETGNSWTATPAMASAHSGVTLTSINSAAQAVLAGGYDSTLNDTTVAEIYDQGTNRWGAAKALTTARGGHLATLLPNGTVLITGGRANDGTYLTSSELLTGVANASACATGTDCMSGQCVDGVCCESACTGQCSACNIPGNVGRCVPSTGAPTGGRAACAGTAPCNGSCNGVNGNACTFPSGNVCAVANGTGVCGGGSCGGPLTCTGTFRDCDTSPGDGCETNTTNNASNCGGCNTVCSTNNMTGVACVASACTGTCNAGFADCANGKQVDGCETNTTNNTSNCGACSTVCSTSNMTGVACVASACTGTCNAGFLDCVNGKQADGCETNDKLNGNCGTCGTTCGGSACAASLCDGSGADGVCRSLNAAACDTPNCTLTQNASFAACQNDGTFPWRDTDGDGFSDVQEDNDYIDTNCNGQYDVGTDFHFPHATPYILSTVAHSGTGAGKLYPTVTNPTVAIASSTIVVTVVASGPVGTATFNYKVNGGAASATITTRPFIDIPGNVRLLFYLANFIVGDTYTFTTAMGTDTKMADRTKPNVYVQYDYMGVAPAYPCAVSDDCNGGGAGSSTCVNSACTECLANADCNGGGAGPSTCAGARCTCTVDSDCNNGGAQLNRTCQAGICSHTEAPLDPLFRLVVAAYAAHGLTLYIDPAHVAVPHAETITFAKVGDGTTGTSAACAGYPMSSGTITGGGAVNFHDVKDRSVGLGFGNPFDPLRKNVFHYTIFSHASTCTQDRNPADNGYCQACPADRSTPAGFPFAGSAGTAELPGNDFIISLGAQTNAQTTANQPLNPFLEAGTFMHELGHNIGLHHDGDVAVPEKAPNYLSVMNYRYTFTGVQHTSGAGSSSTVEDLRELNYSEHWLSPLSEASLSKSAGTSSLASGYTGLLRFFNTIGANSAGPESGFVDWDGTGPTGPDLVSADLNLESGATETMVGYTDWAHTAGDGHTPGAVCVTSADCRQNAVRTNIHNNVDTTVDVHEACVAGVCQPLIYSFQCFNWGHLDGPPPASAKVQGNEQSPSNAFASHELYPVLTANADIRPGCLNNWIILGAGTGTATSVVSYSSSGCVVCGGSYQCLTNDTRNYTDTSPGGATVTTLTVALHGVECGSSATVTVYINGALAGTTSQPYNCSCNGCQTYPTVTLTNPAGIPGYIAGGTNSIRITDSAGSACLHDATVTTTYGSPIPVAVLGTKNFDVTKVTTSSLTFAGAPVLSTTVSDVNGDGFSDLVGQFSMGQVTLNGTATSATLTGWFANSQLFTASGPVQIVQTAPACQPGNEGLGPVCTGYAYNGGCYYQAVPSQTCTQACATHNGINNNGFAHVGNSVCTHWFPTKSNGGNWVSVECCSTDNNTNWGANGAAPDPSFSHPACYLACDCNGD